MHWPVMVPLIAAFVGILSAAVTAAPTVRRPAPLRVMTFNIRNSGAADGANRWAARRPIYLAAVKAFGPDLFGAQEVLADQHDDLGRGLPGYTLAGVAREDGHRDGEWALVAFRTDRFEQLNAGDFWLSDTPDRPSLGWDATCVRITSWVRLRDRSSGRELLFANTHWDHNGIAARRNAAALVKQRLPALSGGAPVILVGDLNSTEDDDWVQSLMRPSHPGEVPLIDSYRQAHPQRRPDEASFHAFRGGTDGSRIDFIFHGPAFRTTAATIDRHVGTDGQYPSDHYAVTAELNWDG